MIDTEIVNNRSAATLAAVLADHDVILSPSFGLLRIEAATDHQAIVKSIRGTKYLYVWLGHGETGWRITVHGDNNNLKLSDKQQAEICALVKEWAKTHVQNFVEADREYFFDLIETSAKILSDDKENLLHLPGAEGDTEFCEAMAEFGPSFLTPAARAGVRRGMELLTSAQRMIREAHALFRQAAAERGEAASEI